MSPKRILVTGGSGFIGAALVGNLVRRGHRVRVLDNLFRGHLGRLEPWKSELELVQADIRDRDAVLKACEGMDVIYHLAYINGTELFYKIPDLILEVGILGAMYTIEGAIKAGAGTYILASTGEVYNIPTRVPTDETERLIIPDVHNPRFSYSGGKITSELAALHIGGRRGLDVRIFRPHNIYGPDMGNEHVIPHFVRRMCALAQEHGPAFSFPIQGDGSETRAFCYIDDAAEGIALILENGAASQIYHVGTPEEVTIADLARRTAKALGYTIELRPGPLLAGSTPRRCPDIAKLSRLGYAPGVDLDTGLARTANWYRDHPL